LSKSVAERKLFLIASQSVQADRNYSHELELSKQLYRFLFAK